VAQVFLSYARSDLRSARRLYDTLCAETGHDVWFDRVSLLAGARWEPAIRKAIREADYFVALLSKRSVAKRGYRHSELRQAVEVLAEFPDDHVYLIPARLDECEMPNSDLDRIHRVDLFPYWKEGVAAIIRALQQRRDVKPAPTDKKVKDAAPQYRVGLIDLDRQIKHFPRLIAGLNEVQSFFQLTALKTPEFRRVARRIEGVRYFDVDRVPARFFEEAKYLAVDLVACVSADALAYTSGGYLHYNYFATSSGPQERFLFLSAEGLEELAAVVGQSLEDAVAYLLVGELVDFFTDVGYHQETKACLMDHCRRRSYLAYGLNARRLCAPCGTKNNTPGLRQAVDAMLKWRNA
jgi:hypothetical protein